MQGIGVSRPLPPMLTESAAAPTPYAVSRDGLGSLSACAPLREAIAAGIAGGEPVALIYAQPHDVSLVARGLGAKAAERLLDHMGRRLTAVTGPAGLVARTADDAFAILVRGIGADADTRARAHDTAERVLDLLNAPFAIGGTEIALESSLGVAVHPHAGATVEQLCHAAELARHEARADGGGIAVHHAGTPDAFESLTAAARLRRAIERDELELHWQGIHRVSDRRLMGTEALVRWRHPDIGLVAPGAFIPLAERTGIIESIGDWVLRELCRQAAVWEAEGLVPKIGMNVSPRQLRRRGYAARLAAEVAAHGVAPERIVFELTESAWVRSGEDLLPVFANVRDAGFTFAIDDFGAGYSSLSRLRDLPADIIKIDRGFLHGVPTDPVATEILLGILRVAAAHGADVTVEGVETEEQLALLEGHGFRFLQGFLLSRPVPAEEFGAALRTSIVPGRAR
jgi:EAL domain-containing protein (putative c-di-GMP-specific phosphodiesterase class I)